MKFIMFECIRNRFTIDNQNQSVLSPSRNALGMMILIHAFEDSLSNIPKICGWATVQFNNKNAYVVEISIQRRGYGVVQRCPRDIKYELRTVIKIFFLLVS